MDSTLFIITVIIPIVSACIVRPVYPLVAVLSSMAACWLILAADLLPMPLLWEGLYGNFYWIICLVTLPPAWLVMAAFCFAKDPKWRKLFMPTVLAVIPAFVIPYVCQEVFRRGFEFLAPSLILAMIPILLQAWQKPIPAAAPEEQ